MRSLNCLHCLIDDHKFSDDIIDSFESQKGCHINKYIIIKENKKLSEMNVSKTKLWHFIEVVNPSNFMSFIEDWRIDVVFIHNLASLPFYLIGRIPPKIKVVWFAWGADLYTFPDIRVPLLKIDKFFHPLTRKILKATAKEKIQSWHSTIHALIHKSSYINTLRRIDYFSGVLPIEYKLLKEQNPHFNAYFLEYTYDNKGTPVSELELNKQYDLTCDILVGNSADPSNNHLDALKKLSEINIKDSLIYVPLSYRGTDSYKNNVRQFGKAVWGEKFVVLEKMLPFEEYKNKILTSGNIIMFHERQQAMGNIIVSLWYGCKVFLSKNSVGYMYLKSIGCKVFSVQDDLCAEILQTNLSKEEIMNNRHILLRLRSYKRRLALTKNIYSTLERDVDIS